LADDPRVRVKSLSAGEPFSVYMKAALLVGAVIASPWVFYQAWAFVAAGLYTHERRYVRTYLPFSLALFLLGVVIAFSFVFEPVLRFLFTFNSWMGIDPDPRINEWLGFVLILPLGFGIGFQLPLVMLFLERIGVMTVAAYWSYWRVAILVIFVVSALLMPPDPYSMTMLAVSLVFLYFGGILLCRFMPRYDKPAGEFAEG
jgi:sec-independent protein translocase protein TatC